MGWTITGPETSGDFADLDLSQLQREQASQAAGSLSFVQGGGYDAAPMFSVGDTIEVFRPDGTRYWYGRVMDVRRSAGGGSESISYRAADPWVWLDRITYQQFWQEAENPGDPQSALEARLRSRVLLALKPDGNKANTGEVIQDILQFAIDSGAPIQIGDIDPAQEVPIDEQRDLTCSEALRRMLRWHPDVSTWFDFSGAGNPTLHVRKRANGPSTTIDAAAAQQVGATGELLNGLDLTPRHDLVIPQVVLKYEITNQTDSITWYTTSVDAAPAGSDGRAIDAMVATIELGGHRASYQSQQVETQSIDASSSAWWKGKLPWLKKMTDVQVSNHAVTPASNRELISGAAPSWIANAAEPVEATATIAYKDGNGNPQTTEAAVNLTGTSLQTATYRHLQSFTPAEPVPAGLAQALLDAHATLHYAGTIQLSAEEVTGVLHPGRQVHISGSRSEYADMGALVQSVSEDVDQGTTRITLGPPEHLGPQDLVAQLRVTRTRVTSYTISTRTSGEAPGASVAGGRQTRADNASTSPGGASAGRAISYEMTIAGDFPTPAEMTTALQDAYTSQSLTPRKGDLVGLTAGGKIIFFYLIWASTTGDNSYWSRNFSVDSVSYGATGWQTGLT